MKSDYREIEALLPGYIEGELPDEDRERVDRWRTISPENEILFQKSRKAWEAMPLLHEMEQFNSFEALKKINTKIASRQTTTWVVYIQKVAAILILPLLIYSGYISIRNISLKKYQEKHTVMQTISSRQGMVTQFELADGTQVWLNSGSSLHFPTSFTSGLREVKLTGEAFFKVTKNEKLPFRVHAKNLNIEVLGTSFNVVSYNDEQRAEVVLVEGKVKLSSATNGTEKVFGTMLPGRRAIYKEDTQKIESEEVVVDKYIAWREGNLIFRDDKMEDVVRRLSRWFNVEIVINDPEIKNYAYKATFRNENLTQVLDLLRISAPIDYQIVGNKFLPNGEYSKQKVYLMKKKI
jgi:ferric-dicitrate binding protein FerR (iron transport regulator)